MSFYNGKIYITLEITIVPYPFFFPATFWNALQQTLMTSNRPLHLSSLGQQLIGGTLGLSTDLRKLNFLTLSKKVEISNVLENISWNCCLHDYESKTLPVLLFTNISNCHLLSTYLIFSRDVLD